MEDNVALDSSKQKKFVKSIKGLKKLIKKNDAESKSEDDSSEKVKKGRVTKRKRKEKGLVYLSHIPHGFYENEMTQYFKQFGVVTNARVIKSKRTGRSKGYAFVEFKEPAVAEIVAETMNNYLMGKRLIKAALVPQEKQKRKVFRKHWNSVNNPGNNMRIKMKKAHNAVKDENRELQRARKLMANINKTKKKLRELGIDYNFFTPVDVPEALVQKAQVKTEEETKENIPASVDQKKKKVKKDKEVIVKDKKVIKIKSVSNEKKKPIQTPVEKSEQKRKKKNLQKKGVTPLEDFIKIQQQSEDSDSSLDFDSDEFDKMLKHDDEGESDISSGAESGEDNEASDDVASDESEEVKPRKLKNKDKALPQKLVSKGKQVKRNAPQKIPVAALPKKPKFEKLRNQKPRNKQFKKK